MLLRFFSSGVPMTEPLPGLVLPTPASSSGAPAPVTQLTTLPNGAKIASEDTAEKLGLKEETEVDAFITFGSVAGSSSSSWSVSPGGTR